MDEAAVYATLKAEAARLGYAFFEGGDWNLNLFGIRGSSRESNLFDDALGCAFQVGGVSHAWAWAGTTDPGRPWLQRPSRPEGCAILCDGQYRGLWQIGLHRGEYEALVQTGPCKVWRDNDRDTVLDLDVPTVEGVFGINMHKAGADSPGVGSWSAGCQVFKRSGDFAAMMSLARNQRDKRGWKSFSYSLFDATKSPALVPVLELAQSGGSRKSLPLGR